MRRVLTLAVVILLAGTPVAANDPVRPTTTLVPFRIQDQNGALHTDRRFTGAALLATWGDRAGSEFMKRWSSILTDSLQAELSSYRLRRLDVGHLRGVPFFIKGRIKETFRRDWSEPVLLDWNGVFDRAYGCAQDSCTILLFDRKGVLVRRWTVGDPEPVGLEKILGTVRRAASGKH